MTVAGHRARAPRTRRSGAPSRSPTRSSAATRREATLSYLRLRQQGERLSGLTYLMAQRLREALAIALRLRAGESAAEVKRGLRMPPRAAERFVADVARTDPDRLREALVALADLEARLARRRGARRHRSPLAGLSEDTLALRAIEEMTASPLRPDASPLDWLPAASRPRERAARDFWWAPVLRCSAPRLTALSIVLTSSRCVGLRLGVIACVDVRLQAAEVGLDRRGVAAVLQALALGAQDPLLL